MVEAESWVLSTESGRLLLAEVIEVPAPVPADVARWRRRADCQFVAAAIRLVECRHRGQAKFSRADSMWLHQVGLEQATSEAVARHKAARFESPVVVDLCTGIGGDAIALAGRSSVLAVDLDSGMCRRTAWNATVYGVQDRLLPCRARAETFPIPRGAWVHVDPDRRASGAGRARRLVDYQPGLRFLTELATRVAAGAIKLSPASDFAAHFSEPRFELELVSLDGECKEATAWFGEAVTCRRRATCLPAGATWTDRDGDPTVRAPVAPVSCYVYDPDPALIRSGLLDSFARAHGLNRLESAVDYFTSDRPSTHPFLSTFEVREVLPLDFKRLRRWVRAHDVGALEIKVRGLDVRPEQVRSALRPAGERAATLILCAGVERSTALWVERTVHGHPPRQSQQQEGRQHPPE
jgi:hypothetical protein